MIKKIAWDTFKNTGDINAFLELKQIENLEKGMGEFNNIPSNTKNQEFINDSYQKIEKNNL